MSSFIVPLSYTRPPLTANQRMHWAHKASITRDVRWQAKLRARQAELPTGAAFATVTLHYRPRDNRRRDRHNLYPTVKALVDGLVDHGLIPDDDARHLSAPEPVIHPAVKDERPAMWLEIETLA